MTDTNGHKKNIFDNATCLILRKTSVGTSRKIDISHIEVDADKDRVAANKSLLKSPELAAIKSLDGFAVRWLYSRSFGKELFAAGIYLVKFSAADEVAAYLEAYRIERDKLITALCDKYPSLVLSDQQALKAEFNASDYPGVRVVNNKLQFSKDALRSEFSIDWEFKTFVTPEMLKQVSPALYEQALAQEQRKVASMTDEVIFGVREEAKKLIAHLIDKLTPTPDGKAKVLHTSSVEKVQDFLETFEKCKNLGDDTQLSALVKSLRSSMSGVTKDQLKSQEPLRDAIRRDFEKANAQLDQLLTDKPKRMFTFEEVA